VIGLIIEFLAFPDEIYQSEMDELEFMEMLKQIKQTFCIELA